MAYILALVPGILIVGFLKQRKLVEKTSVKHYRRLFILGALSIIFAIFLESLGEDSLLLYISKDSLIYAYLNNFLVTAFSEELGKFIVMLGIIKLIQREDEVFGCLAGIYVGLGFGIIENLMYALDEDVTVMILRAIFSVPGHALYGLYMGYFLWLATKKGKALYGTFFAFFLPVIQHGIYDFCLDQENDLLIFWTMIYNIILYTYAIKHLNSLSAENNHEIYASLEVLSTSMP